MAEKSAGGSKPSTNPVVKTIKMTLFVMCILYVLQILLNVPERRPAVACTPLYQAGHFLWLGGLRIFSPTDHVTHLKVSRTLRNFNHQCIAFLDEHDVLDLGGWHL